MKEGKESNKSWEANIAGKQSGSWTIPAVQHIGRNCGQAGLRTKGEHEDH